MITPTLGPYRLIRRVGIGGTAEVFEAIYEGPDGPPSLKAGDCVAVKRALPMISEEPELCELFVDEARLGMRLRHPGIVRVHDYGLYQPEGSSLGDPYLVLEFVSGEPMRKVLKHLIERQGGAPPAAVAAVGIEVAEALACIHGLRGDDGRPLHVIHRDVSPHNLVLRPDGALKLIDFGVAKYQGSARTRTGVVKGKHAYMSPEQAQRLDVDQRSDLFSLGVSLWELAAGRRLFSGPSVPETVDLVIEAEVPRLTEVSDGFPEELADIIMRCLSRDPSRRPESAAALVGELRSWHEQVAAPRPRAALADLYRRCFGERASAEGPPPETAEPTVGWGARLATWAVAAGILAFLAATTAWYVSRMWG